MKILVTGAKGFVGKNLVAELSTIDTVQLYLYDIDNTDEELASFCSDCDFVFHLAGVNRPENDDEFESGNTSLTKELTNNLISAGNCCPVMLSSSVQALLDNPYGKSKRAAEDVIIEYGEKYDTNVYVFRFPNLFGKWCKPNYNSVIATFCYNISRNIPINVDDPQKEISFLYIDDLIDGMKEIAGLVNSNNSDSTFIERSGSFYDIKRTNTVTLGHIRDLLESFRNIRDNLQIPDVSDDFIKKLYSTYLSYLNTDDFATEMVVNEDERGSFTELLKSLSSGQFSVNITKPGITKGNHWHHTKIEKFITVQGSAEIRFRDINSDTIISYKVNGEKIETIDIPPGYTHNITNTGDDDLITIMWANELFDPDHPDTYYLDV